MIRHARDIQTSISIRMTHTTTGSPDNSPACHERTLPTGDTSYRVKLPMSTLKGLRENRGDSKGLRSRCFLESEMWFKHVQSFKPWRCAYDQFTRRLDGASGTRDRGSSCRIGASLDCGRLVQDSCSRSSTRSRECTCRMRRHLVTRHNRILYG